ncbi:carbohydrate ABC transporter permease [Edwardsiella piscicida]|uniref:Binding-protein-dependent transport systems inner membrane component n=3 Tax=Edwardsiella TaxID=635 RepID=A0A0H3DR72_EDWTF|nr:carbohydrate ABC transporter permease [Edwardsiella piscicida]ACY83749.1 putative inner membrane component of binding-protein-dependent transport system [Edwardsiella tarda EIB202]ADM40961.1 binding-protein-dependent transport systems inner membrane component [Edwardsiella tarda FL6-60]AGH72995.1 binding-protein-dependent transport system inner membrane protein [Edwardsiella piscicida C07-087]AOP42355.1 carbohydrate ABC transporter permease [Edwardsiella piscicida]ARD17469.1 ABC transporter
MSTLTLPLSYRPRAYALGRRAVTLLIWIGALLWLLPVLVAAWVALHPAAEQSSFSPSAPLTLENFRAAWHAAPFGRYFINTALQVSLIVSVQLLLATLAAWALVRMAPRGAGLLFALILLQLMISPDVLILNNYQTISALGLRDTLWGIALPYFASAFAIFLLRQTFKGIPLALEEAAIIEGASRACILWRIYVPLATPVYVAFTLVSVSFHWNDFLWPLVITDSLHARPLTVGLQLFSAPEQGIQWALIGAATLMTTLPLLLLFLLCQRRFVQSFMRAGIR